MDRGAGESFTMKLLKKDIRVESILSAIGIRKQSSYAKSLRYLIHFNVYPHLAFEYVSYKKTDSDRK